MTATQGGWPHLAARCWPDEDCSCGLAADGRVTERNPGCLVHGDDTEGR